MLRDYLITALRNIVRHKLYSFINIAGLTVALTCAIFIILFVRGELSYDRWIPGSENLYRVESAQKIPGQPPVISNTDLPFPIVDAMQAQIPEVKAAVHLVPYQMTVTTGNRQFLEHVNVVSPNFLARIRLPLIAGNAATVFAQPESAVISYSAARKYFGSKPAIGQTLKVGGLCESGPNISGCVIRQADVLVTGVLRDFPHNTQLAGDVFIPNTSTADPMSQAVKENWIWYGGYEYVELALGVDSKLVEHKLSALMDRSMDLSKLAGISLPASQVETPRLTPFRNVHLSSDRYGGMTPGGSWTMVYGFAAIAILVLLVGCFNFTNLATARALVRAREMALRKVVGAKRRQLVAQILGESVSIALISLVLALSLTEVLSSAFDHIAGKPIPLQYLHDWSLTLALTGIAALTGLAAGAYPALILSGLRPALALKTNEAGIEGSSRVRGALVVMQFAVSIGLGIVAFVVFAQISFVRTIDLGLNKDGVVVIAADTLASGKQESLVRALDAEPALRGAALSGDVPFSGSSGGADLIQVPGQPGTRFMRFVAIGPDFLSVYGIKLLSGRPLSWNDSARTHSPFNILLNSTAAKRLGYSVQSAIGKSFYAGDDSEDAAHKVRVTIVGVIPDFKFEGDRKEIVPTFYAFVPYMNVISVKIPATGIPQGLAAIDRTWHHFAPSIAIKRHFLDEDFEKLFLADEQQSRVFGLSVGIAIFIACLGLYGLAAFTADRRTKEIGIRKVFGASTHDLVILLLWQFSIPVLIANAIAWPVAWYYLHGWLQGFAYRIALSPLYFLGAGVIAMLIAWGTVFTHARQVANANPIHALRYE